MPLEATWMNSHLQFVFSVVDVDIENTIGLRVNLIFPLDTTSENITQGRRALLVATEQQGPLLAWYYNRRCSRACCRPW